MDRFFRTVFIAALTALLAFPQGCFAVESADIGCIRGEQVALRDEPNADGSIVARLPEGTMVDIRRTSAGDGSWFLVSDGENSGYIRNVFVDTDLSVREFAYERVAVPLLADVRVCKNASGAGDLGILEAEETYPVSQMFASANYHKIKYKGSYGYVRYTDVEIRTAAGIPVLRSLSVEGAELTASFLPEQKGYFAKVTDPEGKVTLYADGAEGYSVKIGTEVGVGAGEYSFTVESGTARKVPIHLNGEQVYEVLFYRDVLCIANWNIKRGNGRIFSQRSIISARDPDILALQEVYICEDNSLQVNNLKTLKTRKLTESLFTRTKGYEENIGQYGIGILSEYPILQSESFSLPSAELGLEPRAVQKIVFQYAGKRISLYNCHLSYERDSARHKQYAVLMEIVNADPNAYKIITGDFNEQWPLFNDLEGWIVTNGRGGQFWGYDGEPFKRTTVDNILVTDNFTVADVSMEDTGLSDHKPLFVMLAVE